MYETDLRSLMSDGIRKAFSVSRLRSTISKADLTECESEKARVLYGSRVHDPRVSMTRTYLAVV